MAETEQDVELELLSEDARRLDVFPHAEGLMELHESITVLVESVEEFVEVMRGFSS